MTSAELLHLVAFIITDDGIRALPHSNYNANGGVGT